MEKRFYSKSSQELDVWKFCPQRHYILGFWDVYSAELLCSALGNENIEYFRTQVLNHLLDDADTLINLLRLSGSENQMNYLIKRRWKISIEQALQFGINFFNSFNKKFEGKSKMGYVNTDLQNLAFQLIDMSDEEQYLDDDHSIVAERAIRDVRLETGHKEYVILPLTYGVEYEFPELPSEVDTRLSDFFTALHQRKFIMGNENPKHQIIEPTVVKREVRDNADLVVGCSKHSRNFLYVVLPEKAKKLGIQSLR